MEAVKSIFETLNAIDVQNKIKTKNGLSYLSWASAWAEIKKRYPDASYKVCSQTMDELGNTRFWHEDGRSGWVEVSVTINEKEITETLAIMDFKNKAIPAAEITSVDANKAMKRCLVKACALHGLGLYIYEGEDLPEESSKIRDLKDSIGEIVKKKCALSDKAKATVKELCMNAEREFSPSTPDDIITGNYKIIDDAEILANLEKQLLAVRK